MADEPYFDAHADEFDASLNAALKTTGEDKDYFARGRVAWLRRCLAAGHAAPRHVLDYGCGTGSATPHFFDVLSVESVTGVDVSARSIDLARRQWQSPRAGFHMLASAPPRQFDLAFCNGVFHHIPAERRARALAYVHAALAPGGWFAFWENNPWNPGTRFVMQQCVFDRDAVMLSPREAGRMLRAAGFEVMRTDFLFIFPRALRAFRGLEAPLARLPLGGQYQALCRRR